MLFPFLSLSARAAAKTRVARARVNRVIRHKARSSCDQSFMFQWILPTDSSPPTTTRPCSRKHFLVRLKCFPFFSASILFYRFLNFSTRIVQRKTKKQKKKKQRGSRRLYLRYASYIYRYRCIMYIMYISECTDNSYAGNDARFPILDSFSLSSHAIYRKAITAGEWDREWEREREKEKGIENHDDSSFAS